ncbi:MAG: HAD-IC family P-type ATPase, partial [Chloroflexi bacterium]|nr:HAD-IC family P-type ATPase [Chloroflexota bacterium]
MENSRIFWHSLTSEEAISKTASRISGLTEEEAKERLARYGANELIGKKKPPLIIVFLRQFLNPLIYVLLAAGIISLVSQFFTGEEHYIDAIVIFGVIILNAVIGTFQESQAEKAMEALLEMAERILSGVIHFLPAVLVLLLALLLAVPLAWIAAGLLRRSLNKLHFDERLRQQLVPLAEDAIIAERVNMLFTSTIITSGRATGVAVLTGVKTEIGKIATGLEEVKEEDTPLQRNIKKLSQYLVFVFLGVSALLVVVGWLQGLELFDLFLLAVAAAVASIPEGLPAVVTVVLAIGMRAMAHRNSIIRRLVAVETLGSATVICSDKTGTLTVNQMT